MQSGAADSSQPVRGGRRHGPGSLSLSIDADAGEAARRHGAQQGDDRRRSLLRVGSANLNNRSMGADTECDLAFEATSRRTGNTSPGFAASLIGHFCGVDEREIESNESRSVLDFSTACRRGGGAKSLQPIDPAATGQRHGSRRAARRRSRENRFTSTAPPIACGRQEPFWPCSAWSRRSPASRWPGSTHRCAISPTSASSPPSFRNPRGPQFAPLLAMPPSSSAGWWCFRRWC